MIAIIMRFHKSYNLLLHCGSRDIKIENYKHFLGYPVGRGVCLTFLGLKFLMGFILLGVTFFHQNLYFWVKNIENILYVWVLRTVTQHLQLHFI